MSEHELWNELGNLYFMSGTYNQAAYAYRRAIQLDGGFGRPYCNLALTYVKQGRFEEAVQLYQRSIELLVDETERAITWYRLGDVYRHLKDYRDAILAYQAADMLDAELSPKDKETDHILYGGAEVRLVQAGAVSPSIPETVPSTEAAASQPEPVVPVAEELSQPAPAPAEIPSPVSAEAAEDVQQIPAPVSEAADPVEEMLATVEDTGAAPTEMEDASAPAPDLAEEIAPAEETPAAMIEEVALMDPVEEGPAAAGETAADATMVQDASAPAPDSAAEMTPAEETPAGTIEEIAVMAAVEESPAAAVEPVLDTAAADEIAAPKITSEAVEEIMETLPAIEEDSPELQRVQAVDELPATEASEPAFAESPAGSDGETEPVLEAAAPEAEMQAPEMAAEEPVTVEAETAPVPGVEVSSMEEAPVLNTPPAEGPANDELTEVAASAADWEEYVVSSMEEETDVQPLGDPEKALDAWLPEVEMVLSGAEMEQPVDEPAVLDPDPVSDDFPKSAEGAFFSPEFPGEAAGTLTSEDMLAAIPSVALDFREEDTQPIFIVPEEMEQGFSVVQVESGTTDVACAAESEEPDAEMQGILAEIERFKHAVQANPRNAPAWDTLGTLYKAARKYREAIMAYQQAVSVDPSKPHYHHHLGILYAIEGREEEAIRAFQDVIDLDPNHSLANATLGGYYRKMGLEELAQKHIGKAMKNFYTSENEYNRACLEALCGNTEQSLELLRIALKNKQTYVDWVLRDPDLDSIRRDPRFKQLISDYATW